MIESRVPRPLSPAVALSLNNSRDRTSAKARELSRLRVKEQRRLVRSLHSDLPELHRHVTSLDPCNLIPRARMRAFAKWGTAGPHRKSRIGEISSCPRPQNSIFATISSAAPRAASQSFRVRKAGSPMNFFHRWFPKNLSRSSFLSPSPSPKETACYDFSAFFRSVATAGRGWS